LRVNDGYAPSGSDWIYYREAGSGHPVVFIHAGVADSRMWLPQLEAVPDGFRYIAFDQRGFGNSKVGGSKYNSYRDVLALMDYLDCDKAVLVGCSIGAGIALDLAIEAPKRVSGLVLVGADSPGFEPEEGLFEPPQWREAVAAFKAGDYERVAQLDAEIWLAGHGRELDQVDPDLRALFLEMDLHPLRSEGERDELRTAGPDREKAIRGIEKPTLVMVGAYDMPDLQAAAHHLASRLSKRSAVVIEDAAHLPGFEQPDAFNAALVNFLETIT
jgi:pimeloyl-ACP methyl ester carboxylesterase